MFKKVLLTFNIYDDPLGHGGRHRVGGDAEVRAHLRAADALEAQRVAFVHRHWNKLEPSAN